VDTDNVQFQNELHKLVGTFRQNWPVSDFGGPVPGSNKSPSHGQAGHINSDSEREDEDEEESENEENESDWDRRDQHGDNEEHGRGQLDTDVELHFCGTALAPLCKKVAGHVCKCCKKGSVSLCCRKTEKDDTDYVDGRGRGSSDDDSVVIEPEDCCCTVQAVINLEGLKRQLDEPVQPPSYRIAYFKKCKT
jgi:hypothetical protein